MHSRFRMKGVLLAALVAVLAVSMLPATAHAGPQPGATRKGFRLFARALGAMTINRVLCGLSTTGEVCVDSTNSSTIGGGFWPKGTPDQYVFNSGLQLAGIIGPDGGPWAGDTTGAFFFDPKGTTQHGEEVQPIFNSTGAGDLAAWPGAACVPQAPDPGGALFDPLLQSDPAAGPVGGVANCRKSASQGDLWFMSWEGNPSFKAGRKHPLGVAVETRGMGWNFPAGNEDILYFIYTFYNISSTNRADYAGIRAPMVDILTQKAQEFQDLNLKQGVTLPPGGYTINNLFAAFGADMDVAEAGSNYSSVNLPFALGNTYDHTFSKPPEWQFDPSIFGAPFFTGSGFVGVKYLKSPTGPGAIQLFSNTINGGAFGDARDVLQLFRYLSGTLSTAAGDQACNTGNPAVTRICFINNSGAADMRFFQSSTALTLPPGGQGSIVVAYIFAAPVKTAGCGAACDVKPGDPRVLTDPVALATTGATTMDTLTGFKGYTDLNGDGIVQQDEFKVVPGSLLGKSLVAQAVFDGKFLLPFAPAPPEFFLIPGDNQVTVLWKPSPSEASGDPFFALANAPRDATGAANALYDPNYRQNDVEGYRVYRGRVDASNELTLLGQFDYSGTVISDFTGVVNPVKDCAPELAITSGCAAALAANNKDGTLLTESVDYPLVGDLIQLSVTGPTKGRLKLADGTAIITKTDTAVVGAGKAGGCGPKSACPPLDDTGVPFVFVDKTPRNSFRYFYVVTAFDVNSVESGPTSLESTRSSTKSVTPVRPASNFVNTATLTSHILGRGQAQDSVFPSVPTLDAATGKFSGPMPPADGVTLGFVGEFAKQVIAAPGALALTLDSIGAGSAYDALPTTYYMTAGSGGSTLQLSVPLVQDVFDGVVTDGALFDAVKIDNTLSKLYGGDSSFALKGQASVTISGNYHTSSYGRGCINGATGFSAGGGCDYNGGRWFDGPSPTTNETLDNPTAGNDNTTTRTMNRVTANNAGFNNAGALTGVTVVHQTIGYNTTANSYRQVEGVLGSFKRAADYNVYWNATTAGLIDSVIDVTHNLVVPFNANFLGASYGILNQAAAATFTGSFDNRSQLTLTDFGCIPPLRTFPASAAIIGCTAPAYALSQQAVLGPIAFFTGTAVSNAQISTNTGTGFALYMPGDLYMFQLAALPQGTVWSLRDYVGAITGGNGHTGDEGPYAFFSAKRPFSAVGASVSVGFDVTNLVRNPTSGDLKTVHTVPDPYYVTSAFEQSADNKIIKFVNLPQRAIIRIYSSSGVLVTILEHNSTTNGGEETWNVRNRNNQVVASGVYFYHVEANGLSGGSARRIGRMTIVNFAQ